MILSYFIKNPQEASKDEYACPWKIHASAKLKERKIFQKKNVSSEHYSMICTTR